MLVCCIHFMPPNAHTHMPRTHVRAHTRTNNSHRVLFPNSPEVADELFMQSQVSDQLRAQELTLRDVGALCKTYEKLVQSLQTGVR